MSGLLWHLHVCVHVGNLVGTHLRWILVEILKGKISFGNLSAVVYRWVGFIDLSLGESIEIRSRRLLTRIRSSLVRLNSSRVTFALRSALWFLCRNKDH